jgi:hypothetical protein
MAASNTYGKILLHGLTKALFQFFALTAAEPLGFNANGQLINVTAPSNGTNGTNGNTVLNGSGAPAGGTGVNGDFYIDTAAWDIYGPKAAGAWPSGVSLIGPPA